LGWSEPAAISAQVEDGAVQAVLGMNQKHILFPYIRIFQPFFCPKIFPSYLPPPPPFYLPPTSLTSFFAHSISRVRESSWAWIAQSLKETWDTRVEEGGELNVEGMWRRKGKKNVSSQMREQEKKDKFLPFSAFFYYLFIYFFCVFFSFCSRIRRRHCLLLSVFCFYLKRRRWRHKRAVAYFCYFIFCYEQSDNNKLAAISKNFLPTHLPPPTYLPHFILCSLHR